MRSKVKLSLMPNRIERKATFKKRKKGVMKKINELTTLCDVKACAVIYSPFEPNPDFWPPSKEGVEEVVDKFMGLSLTQRSKKMLDPKSYALERIHKSRDQVRLLSEENRESQLKELMFNCLQGDMIKYRFEAKDLRDLSILAGRYINDFTHRINFLTKNGESSSSFPPPLLAGESSLFGPAPASVDHIPYDNMAMSQNHTATIGFNEHTNMSRNEPYQYQTYAGFLDATPLALADAVAVSQNPHESVQYQTPTLVTDVTPYAGANATAITTPTVFYDHIHQYQNMNHNL